MTHLRRLLLDELQRRNYAETTAVAYVHALREFAGYFKRPPDQLGIEHVRAYQLHLLRDRGLSPSTVMQHMAAIRFFFVHTLRRYYPQQDLCYPKYRRKLPVVLSREEVASLIDGARTIAHRALLMTLYSTGMRRAELAKLKLDDVDSKRMVIRVRQGKGSKDRDLPLSPRLLETLREHWRLVRSDTYLFPPLTRSRKGPLTGKAVYFVVRKAALRAGIKKRVGPHTLRHSFATHLLDAGADLPTIQLLLGHSDIRHTTIYIHLSERHLHAVANPLDGLTVLDLETVKRSRRYGGK